MRNVRRGPVLAAVLTAVLAAGQSWADNNPNGMSFRAVGWFKGKSEITAGRINCEIPNVQNAISEGAFAMGLWNTYGAPTIYYPDVNSSFGNPCGVWMQLQNNLIDQAINLDKIQLRYRIAGAKKFRNQGVATKNGFPMACQPLRNETLFIGNRLNPINSNEETSSSGAPNIAFIEMLPFVTPEMVSCLRSQYAGLATFTSFPLVVRATAFGQSDGGASFQSNTIQYTLNLRHFCGNGRVDDGEECDPEVRDNSGGTLTTCIGVCSGGHCSQSDSIPCTVDADCSGSCLVAGNPSECTCAY